MKRWVAALAAIVGLSACMGHAELVKRDASGGVLALKGDREKAMIDAKQQMSANCAGGYDVVGEEMAKVGEVTQAKEDTQVKSKGASTNTSVFTQDLKEYRITYKCKGAT